MKERLQKLLARAGYGSRRRTEALVRAGRVSVNGQTVDALGARADPERDDVAVDGTPLTAAPAHVYLAMHKPAGVITTARDPRGRPTVLDLLPDALPPAVLPVGRLDRDTEGLLLFTNDGELAYRLAHPRFEMEKEYLALVAGEPPERALRLLRRGVEIDGRATMPARVQRAAPPAGHRARDGASWLCIVIHEGRNRQVRRMFDAVGHPVLALLRTRVGPVALGRMRRGAVRPLSPRELRSLRASLDLGEPAATRPPAIRP